MLTPVGGSGTPGGTTGQLQWNNAGAFAGVGNTFVMPNGDIGIGGSPTNPFHIAYQEVCNATTVRNAASVIQYSPTINKVGGSIGEIRCGTSKLAGTSVDETITLTAFEIAVETFGTFATSRSNLTLAWPVMPAGASASLVIGTESRIAPSMIGGIGSATIFETYAFRTSMNCPAAMDFHSIFAYHAAISDLPATSNWYGVFLDQILIAAATKTHIYLGALTGAGVNRALWARQNAGDLVVEDFAGSGSAFVGVDANGKLSRAAGGGVPTTITVANEATDTQCFPAFFTAATGDQGPKTLASWTLNSATGAMVLPGTVSSTGGQTASERFGASSAVTGVNATAIGNGASAVINGTALGQGATASGNGALAIGLGSTCSAGTAIAIGQSASCTGSASTVVIGSSASSSQNSSVAVGASSVGGLNSVALGASANAANAFAIALGCNAATSASNQLSIGSVAGGTIDSIVLPGGRAQFNANVVVGSAAIATNATDGFLYIPSCAGTPTGTPTVFSGRLPVVFDSTNDILYIYRGGWKKAVANVGTGAITWV